MKSITVTLIAALSVTLLSSGSCMKEEVLADNNQSGQNTPPTLPDRDVDDGATIAGCITDETGIPISGVAVSDGVTVVNSDNEGKYRIMSDKAKGYVFISLPGNYTIETNNGTPGFFRPLLLSPDKLEVHDFILKPCDNNSYSVIIHTDQHLVDRTEDILQFDNYVLPDILESISSRKKEGRNAYSISLGDIGWEQFWRSNNFGLSDAVKKINSIGIPIFHVMGNHDNDPYLSGDWNCSGIFRETIGPTYYSFNIGQIHFIVLDNVIYNNIGASSAEMGDRSYDRAISSDQLAWLTADLAHVKDKSAPLIICGHVPFMSEPKLVGGKEEIKRNLLNMVDLERCLEEFKDITFFSGHYHRNFNIDSPFREGMREFNVASLSGTLWWTRKSGYSNHHVCTDGSPGGYGILDVDGKHFRYTYKGVGYSEDNQFRIYDLNTIHIAESSISNPKYADKVKEYAGRYYTPASDNEILVNVFNWGPGWKIEITEEGKPLSVTRIRDKDPLHILSYECQRLSHGYIPTSTSTLLTQNTSHIFSANADKATSSIKVTVTDNYGRSYSSTIKRPLFMQ